MTLVIVLIIVVVLAISGGVVFGTQMRRRGSVLPQAGARQPHVAPPVTTAAPTPTVPSITTASQAATSSLLERPAGRPVLSDRLGRARGLLAGYFDHVRGRPGIDAASFEELEEALILADVGVATTTRVLADLRGKLREGALSAADPPALLQALQDDLISMFEGDVESLAYADGDGPTVWLFVGVNGVGKTTTIGKLALRETQGGRGVVLAAGDTFRAAAGEQLESWAERAGARIVRGSDGADPSSVIFDAVAHAASRGAGLVLADTAGRLHTKVNLMDELRKVRRVAERPPGQLTEVLLVLDATTGQNGVAQARQFTEAVGVTGIVLTKLDGTAKGGVVLAIRSELGLPIKLVGVGEGPADLVPFDPVEFVSALFS